MSALIDWDRLPTETPKSYAAFLAYVALGARRSVREATRPIPQQPAKSPALRTRHGGTTAVRAASRVIVENFPPVARVADVSDGPYIEDLSDIPDADLELMKEIRDAARAKSADTRLTEQEKR